jgi:hypothetical protein
VSFRKRRLTISGGTAAIDVSDTHFFPLHSDRFDDLVEKLTGAADKGLALRIFIGAWSFTDEHQIGFVIPDRLYDLSPAFV